MYRYFSVVVSNSRSIANNQHKNNNEGYNGANRHSKNSMINNTSAKLSGTTEYIFNTEEQHPVVVIENSPPISTIITAVAATALAAATEERQDSFNIFDIGPMRAVLLLILFM